MKVHSATMAQLRYDGLMVLTRHYVYSGTLRYYLLCVLATTKLIAVKVRSKRE